MSLPEYRKDGSQSRESIIAFLKDRQLKRGIELFLLGKTNYYIWDNYPFIPNFQEIYFWEMIELGYRLEKKGVFVIEMNNKGFLYNDKKEHLLLWASTFPNQWIPKTVQQHDDFLFRFLRSIPILILNGYHLKSEYVNRYLLRQYLLLKLQIKGRKLYDNPYAIQRLLENEKKVQEEYKRIDKNDFRRRKAIALELWDLLSPGLEQSKEYQKWLKKNPIRHYRVSVRDAFPKETQKNYPYTIPMFEEKLRKLREK